MNDVPKPEATSTVAVSVLAATLELARRGNRAVQAQLRRTLDAHPEIWQHNGDLTRLLEQAWIDRIGGSNLLLTESLRCTVEQMRTDLAGPEPAALEKLLVDRIVASWLAVQEAELTLAIVEGEGTKVTAVRIKNADAAHRRFVSASKCLAQVRRLTAGISIRVEHAVNSANQGGNGGRAGGRLGKLMEQQEAMGMDANVLAGVAS